jgi:pilus assembly protein CpaE
VTALTFSRRVRVLLIEDDAGDALVAGEVLAGAGFEVEQVTRLADGLRRLAEARMDLVLLDLSLPDSTGVDTYLRLHSGAPWAPVVIMTGMDDEALAARAIAEGAQDYIVKGQFGPQSLRRAIRFALERQQHATAVTAGGARVLSVIGPKGGVGKSTVAVNVAAALHSMEKRPVALIDLSLQCGDIGMMLNLHDKSTLIDFCNSWPNVNDEVLENVIQTGPHGLRVLQAPNQTELSELVQREHLTWILDVMKQRYSNVVIDHASHLTDISCEMLERSDRILFVVDLHMASAKTLMTTLAFFRAMRLSTSNVMLVVNRGDERTNFTVSELEKTLHFPISAVLPSAPALLLRGEGEGMPVVFVDKNAPISREYRKLAKLIQSEPMKAHSAA